MELEYRNWSFDVVGKMTLLDNVFNVPLRKDVIARVINWQRAKRRSGNHSTKTRSMVSGTTRKPWGQKETGKARQGSLRSPHFRGGGIVFGPHPRSYEYSLPKKIRALGLLSALSEKVRGKFFVVEDLNVPFTKTSAFVDWKNNYEIKSCLFVVSDKQSCVDLNRCVNNVPYCDVLPVVGLNVYDLVSHDCLIFDSESINIVNDKYSDFKVSFVERVKK